MDRCISRIRIAYICSENISPLLLLSLCSTFIWSSLHIFLCAAILERIQQHAVVSLCVDVYIPRVLAHVQSVAKIPQAIILHEANVVRLRIAFYNAFQFVVVALSQPPELRILWGIEPQVLSQEKRRVPVWLWLVLVGLQAVWLEYEPRT